MIVQAGAPGFFCRHSRAGGDFNSRMASHPWTLVLPLFVVPAKAGIHLAVAVAVAVAVAFARHSGEGRVFNSRMAGHPASLLLVLAFEGQKRFVRYAAEFISFDKRQKKRTKEKRFSRRSSPRTSLLSGFFDSPSWLGRKTAHIRVRRPPGLSLTLLRKDF